MIRHAVPQGIVPGSLQHYLTRAYPLLNVRALLKKRDVKVNGLRREGEFPLRPGDELLLYGDCDFSIRVLGQGNGLLAVEKPQGLPVDVDSDGIGADTALSRARAIFPEAELCHRLDAATGGVLVLATEKAAWEAALAAFREHRVEKRYQALAGGEFSREAGEYRDFLKKDAARARVRIGGDSRGALRVETRWRRLEKVGQELTRVEMEPVTGRTHQLRAHMAYHGHPLLGDDKYGDRALNRRHPGKLRLWCCRVRILGAEFTSQAPQWPER